jgi:hypothetical protein
MCSYRQRAIKANGARCSSPDCPLRRAEIPVPRKMLDVDHRDGDRSNNAQDNLVVLCVWCHATKTRHNWP